MQTHELAREEPRKQRGRKRPGTPPVTYFLLLGPTHVLKFPEPPKMPPPIHLRSL